MQPNIRLKGVILRSGLKQHHIASLLGIHETRLSKIINRHVEPTPEERKKISELFKIPEEKLFGVEGGDASP